VGGQPCRAINTLDNVPVTYGLPGGRSFTYQLTSTAPAPQLFVPTQVAVNGLPCTPSPLALVLPCAVNNISNCTPVWFCCGAQVLSLPPPLPPPPSLLPPLPLRLDASALAPGPVQERVDKAPSPASPLGTSGSRLTVTPHRRALPAGRLTGIVVGCVAGAVLIPALILLVLRQARRSRAGSEAGRAGRSESDGADSNGVPSAAENDAAPVPVSDDEPGSLLRTRSLPVLQRRPSFLPQPGDEENGTAMLRRSSTISVLQRTRSIGGDLSRRASATADSNSATELDFDSEIEVEALLGSGAFGSVFRARWTRLGGARVAVKMLHNLGDTSGADGPGLASFQSEVALLQRLAHPNIVRFLGACLTPPNACMVEELVEGGSLHAFLHGPNGRRCTPAEFSSLAQDIASAMAYLHAIPVVHRDLKAQNVLLDGSGRCKVCDFGLAKVKQHTYLSTMHIGAGTPAYMAPELFHGSAASEKVDVWACGTLLWEMWAGQVPWGHLTSPVQIIFAIAVQHDRLPIPDDCPPQVAQLMRSCWAPSPEERPPFAAMLDVFRAMAP
jgi:hypothetical protein